MFPSETHPKRDDQGRLVLIHHPSSPTPLQSWLSPVALAAAVPASPLPPSLNGIDFLPWVNAPTTIAGWEALAEETQLAEPEFDPPKGLAAAAGVLILETDNRVWLVCPTNRYGGYSVTFPKGRLDGKTLQATAIAEAYEESGLHVRLLRHLIDVRRSTTYTRYYLAERIGGSPADMGWESQCIMLVPHGQLSGLKLKTLDRAVLRALRV